MSKRLIKSLGRTTGFRFNFPLPKIYQTTIESRDNHGTLLFKVPNYFRPEKHRNIPKQCMKFLLSERTNSLFLKSFRHCQFSFHKQMESHLFHL